MKILIALTKFGDHNFLAFAPDHAGMSEQGPSEAEAIADLIISFRIREAYRKNKALNLVQGRYELVRRMNKTTDLYNIFIR